MLLSPLCKRLVHPASVVPWFLGLLALVLLACQPSPTQPVPASTSTPVPTPAPSSTTTPLADIAPADTAPTDNAPTDTASAAFTYIVNVLDEDDQPIPQAQLIIEIEGKAPLENEADDDGYARIAVPASHAGRPGLVRVRAADYAAFSQNIDIYEDRLPNTVRLALRAEPAPTPTPTLFPPGQEGETLVVIADFLDQQGNDPDRFTRNLVTEIRATLADYGEIRVERLMRAIPDADGEGSAVAMQIGEGDDINASIVIWGDYVGTERQPQAHIHFDIVKPVSSFLTSSLYKGYGPIQIAEQPSMFDFTVDMGTQLGQATAFIAGITLYNADRYKNAAALFNIAIPVASQPLAADFQQVLHYYHAANYWHLGRFRKAKLHINTILLDELPDDIETNDLYQSILIFAGAIHAGLGERRLALDYFKQVLPIFQKIGDKDGAASTLLHIGDVYSGLGENQRALDFHKQALPIFQEMGDKVGEASTLTGIGVIYFDLGENQMALDFYKQALPIHRETGDKIREATTLSNIGRVYYSLRESQTALDFYKQALPIHRTTGYKAGEADTLHNIGNVYASLRKHQQALDFYKQALLLRREVGDRGYEASTLGNIGRVYHSLGKHQQALDFYKQALLLRRETEDKAREADTLHRIAAVYSSLRKHQQALDFYKRALLLRRETEDKASEGVTLGTIGTVYYALDEMRTALVYLNDAVKIHHDIGAVREEVTTYWWIGLIYQKLGDLDAAANSLETAITLATELVHPDLPQLQALLDEINGQRAE